MGRMGGMRRRTRLVGDAKKFSFAKLFLRSDSPLFFETRWAPGPSSPQPGVREPRENRGRLRHCNGLQTPTATGPPDREGGSEVPGPKSGYRFGCARRGLRCKLAAEFELGGQCCVAPNFSV